MSNSLIIAVEYIRELRPKCVKCGSEDFTARHDFGEKLEWLLSDVACSKCGDQVIVADADNLVLKSRSK